MNFDKMVEKWKKMIGEMVISFYKVRMDDGDVAHNTDIAKKEPFHLGQPWK